MSEHAVAARFERGGFTLDVDLAWDERVVVFFGPSGAGKSTLFELVLGLHPKAHARVRLGGAWLTDAERGLHEPSWRRGLGWVPQDPTLFPHRTVEGNLRFAPRGAAAPAALAQAVEVLELGPLLGRDVRELSGGERQRVAIGRALASAPRALLLDEPLASLDTGLRARALRHLLRIRDELALPILAITHDPDEALLLGERVCVLEAGRAVASGPPAAVLWSAAVLPLSAALGLENVFEGQATATGLETPGGLRLALPAAAGADARVCVGVRAEDVLLAVGAPGRISARNVLEARVARCEASGDDTFVHLEVGPGEERLVAKVTDTAATKLELREGLRVHAIIKAQAIRRLA